MLQGRNNISLGLYVYMCMLSSRGFCFSFVRRANPRGRRRQVQEHHGQVLPEEGVHRYSRLRPREDGREGERATPVSHTRTPPLT